jgi:hypothetical protein
MDSMNITLRKTMRSLGNALVWIGLTVGLPGVLYALMAVPNRVEESPSNHHNPATCAVCRHCRGVKNNPPQIEDEDMILVSPGHVIATSFPENDAGPGH